MHSNKAVLTPASFKGGNAHIQGFAGTESPVQGAVLGSEGSEMQPLFLRAVPCSKIRIGSTLYLAQQKQYHHYATLNRKLCVLTP
jgi:hypothetical protein